LASSITSRAVPECEAEPVLRVLLR
jgi:hypothetical protein